MNARSFTNRTTLLSSIAISALVAASAVAAGPSALLVAPGEPNGLPKFGFSSSNIGGYGERVQFVRYGSRASKIGLEPGDVILSLNGYRLTYPGSWNEALSHAVYHDGGQVRLRVRDVRTGSVVRRDVFIGGFGGDGPVVHYNVTTPHVDRHNDFEETIRRIGRLVD